MNNRRLEYNPLFESIVDSARRYEKISEEVVDDNYKMEAAINYAKKIVQMLGDQVNYYVFTIPNPTVRATTLKALMEFWGKAAAGSTFEEIFNMVSSQWDTLEKSIANSAEMKVYVGIEDVYAKVSGGIQKMKETAKIYLDTYPEESKNGVVNKAVQDIAAAIKTNIEEINKTTNKS